MRLLLSLATLPLFFETSNCFAFPSTLTKSRTRSTLFLIKEDPYVDLVKAYQKKSAVPSVVADPIPTVTVDATPTLPDIPDVKEAAQEVVKDVTEKASFVRPVEGASVSTKAPTLGDMIQQGYDSVTKTRAAGGGGPPTNTDDFDRVANAKEKWALIQENYNRIISDLGTTTADTKEKVTAISESAKGVSETATKAVAHATDAVDLPMSQLSEVIEKFHLDQYGGFILAGLVLLYAAVQRNAGKEDAKRELAEQLANADEETLAAVAAAFEREKLRQLELEKASIAVEVEPAEATEPVKEIPSKKEQVKGAAKPAVKEAPAKKAPSKKKSTKTTSKKKKAPKAKASTKTDSTTSDNPWGSLTDSSLMRKTAKALSEYLTERGASATDENGKLLKKADMVSAIKSL